MKEKINQLKKALNKAAIIDECAIADKILSIGYKCQRCARCCMEDYGDNTVSIFPFEIRRISEKTELKREDIAFPAPSEDRDAAGNIHTFEWVLRKNGDCMFLDNGLCKIYEYRPYICSTYPFYLFEGRLMVSECEGLGGAISKEEAAKMAALLKERYIAEIRESIALLEKFRGFKPGGRGNICIHDSEGEHWIRQTE
ncbi:MAG: YkgJ family cysteine cluster protein [Euryarchaeota archaeon]|nr:YkgJ family cysteine cluster protein [Euryarchaeota archaeon]MCG2735460.1 YkgJ family cysteine cluster protein [Candidatus Methanoperedenaceae archaeon]